MIRLYIALFWLVLGLGLFFVPGGRAFQILDTGISFGWILIVLAVYNLIRWGLWYGQQRTRRERDSGPPPAPREYNPEFDFTKEDPEQK